MKKKTLRLAALTVLPLLVVACSTDDSVTDQIVESNQPMPVAFNTYLGRAASTSTRSSITDVTSIGNDGVGVFAMYTKDSVYAERITDHGVQTGSTYTEYETLKKQFLDEATITNNFRSNFMNNVKVWNNNGTWTYNDTRYWPTNYNECVSFIAYGPYDENAKLYTQKETTVGEGNNATTTTTYQEGGGNAIYYKYGPEKAEGDHTHKMKIQGTEYTYNEYKVASTKDLVWNWKNTRNLQLYWADMVNTEYLYSTDYNISGYTGNPEAAINSDWHPSDNEHTFSIDQLNDYFCVHLNMAHATSRIAFVVSCPALQTSDNYSEIPEDQDTIWSGAQITIDTVMILGDLGTEGYLNIANNTGTYPTDDNGKSLIPATQWDIKTTDQGYFPFYKYVNGEYDGSSSDKYLWKPSTTECNLIKGVKDKDGKITVNTIGNSAQDYLFVTPDAQRQNYFIYIAWTVKYRNGTSDEVLKKGIHYNTHGLTNAMALEAGKAYVFNMQIGRSDGGSTSFPYTHFNAIHFSVDVEDWDNEQSVPVYGGLQGASL